jgi:uncharacterized protein YuzE
MVYPFPMIKVDFDYAKEIAYLHISEKEPVTSLRASRSVDLELDQDGSIVTIKFLDVTPELSKALITTTSKTLYRTGFDK